MRDLCIGGALLGAIVVGCSGQYQVNEEVTAEIVEQLEAERARMREYGPDDYKESWLMNVTPQQIANEQAGLDAALDAMMVETGDYTPPNPDRIVKFDSHFDRMDAEEVVPHELKTKVAMLHGFAVNGQSVTQDGGPRDHCTMFGLSCDGQKHKQAADINLDSLRDIEGEVKGRCGAIEPGGVDNAFYPCIVPRAETIDIEWNHRRFKGKEWLWTWETETCQDPGGDLQDILHQVLVDMFHHVGASSDWVFIEVPPDSRYTPNIKVGCFGDVDGTSLASGYPTGRLKLEMAADQVILNRCEEPGLTDREEYHFGDMLYSYNKGVISINWGNLWRWVTDCGTNRVAVHKRLRTVVLHEILHVMGFTHAGYPRYNVMHPTMSCPDAVTAASRQQQLPYYDALHWVEHDNSKPLQLLETGLACNLPYNGRATQYFQRMD